MRADILAKIKQHHYELGLHLHDDFLDKFNFKSYFVIDDVKNNAKTATLEKWDEWIKEGINNKDIQEYIAINPNTPEPILHKLLTTGRTYQDTIIDLAKRDDLTVALIKKMMAKANDKTIATLFTKLPYPSENINPKLADVIVPVVVEHIVDTKTTIPHTVYFDAFEFTKDEKSILYLLDSDAILTENVLDKIASNKNLSDETRNRVFDMGCNYETLNSYTPYMAKKIYESAIESAIDNGEISLKINNIRNQAFEVLMNLANNKAIDDSMVIDMLNRIYHPDLLPFTSNGRLITETIDKVASPYIIDYIYDYSKKFTDSLSWKKILIGCEHISDKVYKNIIIDSLDEYYKKFNTVGIAYKSTAMESNDLQFIASHISKFDLGHHQYHTLSKFLKSENQRVRQFKELKDAFVSSMYVPENFLKDADNKEYNFSKKQQFLANLNLNMRQNGLDKHIHHITDIFRFDYTNAYALEDVVTLVQQIKDIVKDNINKIKNETVADEKLIEELNKKIEVFDFKIRNIEIHKQVEKMERTKASRYIQGLQKNCEVYAYIDDLIDAIEYDKKKYDEKKKEEKNEEKEVGEK